MIRINVSLKEMAAALPLKLKVVSRKLEGKHILLLTCKAFGVLKPAVF